MKSKLIFLLAVLTLIAVFGAAPALTASPSGPFWNAPAANGSGTLPVTNDFLVLLQAQTILEGNPADNAVSVEFLVDAPPIDGSFVSLGFAQEADFVGSRDWRLNFDSSGYSIGPAQVRAVARNIGGEFSVADANVTFVDRINPTVDSLSPLAGSDVTGGVFDFSITTSDNVGATTATYSLSGDNGSFLPMASDGGGVFSVDNLNVSSLPNGGNFFYVEIADAAGNTAAENVSLNILNPQAPTLDTTNLEHYGSLQVGGEGYHADEATYANNGAYPTPTIAYSWNVCNGGDCTIHPGADYTPLESEIGRTVELIVTATNSSGSDSYNEMISGTVTAAAPVVEPEGPQSGDPTPTPEPTPTPPTTTPPVTNPPVVSPTVTTTPPTAPEGKTVVKTGSAPQKVSGTAGPDRITTGSGFDVIRAGAGNDRVRPGKGGGRVYAGAGNDTVQALASKSLYVNCGTGKDTLFATQTTKSVGCEKIVVSSNKTLVTVKNGADSKPVMPANFNGPSALAPKASVVIAADKKVAVAVALAAKEKAAAAITVKKAEAAAKAVQVALPVLKTAVKTENAAEKAALAAAKAQTKTQEKLLAALNAKKGVAAAQTDAELAAKKNAAARAAEIAAEKKTAVAEKKAAVASKAAVETKTAVV
ncbi:MAG TPA: hypothetical protein VFV62_03975, partial [Gaiellaceae bacterium]|nr:hypothetical protein [Gaiellaceae bacterium]